MLPVGKQCELIATGMFHCYMHHIKGVLTEESMGRYLTRNFKMRDPDFTTIDQMSNPNIDLNTARKDNWQEANEAQRCNVSGGY